MQYWVAYKNGAVVEQIFREEEDELRWSEGLEDAEFMEVSRHGDLMAEELDPQTGIWTPRLDYAIFLMKEERLRLLKECDYPPLYERPEEEQPAWRAYRQALRDLPDHTDPFNPEWPEKPTFGNQGEVE
jgi:hypothetical protein